MKNSVLQLQRKILLRGLDEADAQSDYKAAILYGDALRVIEKELGEEKRAADTEAKLFIRYMTDSEVAEICEIYNLARVRKLNGDPPFSTTHDAARRLPHVCTNQTCFLSNA